jgi:KDO2-lipid IV(A) lauroyltransferase
MKKRPFLSKQWRRYWIWHPLQAAPAIGLMRAVGLLPIDWVSGLGAAVTRRFGPRLKRPTARTLRNLAIAFPELSAEERHRIMVAMWANLGRIGAEYAVLGRIADSRDRVELEGAQNIVDAYHLGRPVVFVSGHIGHWEIAPVMARIYDIPVTGIYRPPDNRFIDRAIRELRRKCGMTLLPRGRESVRDAMAKLAEGENLAILVDQRHIFGRNLPFFGHPAQTATTAADMAIRYQATILPVRVKRLRGARFRVIAEKMITPSPNADRTAEADRLMTDVNGVLERWIRDTPEQWLWPHRRWGD